MNMKKLLPLLVLISTFSSCTPSNNGAQDEITANNGSVLAGDSNSAEESPQTEDESPVKVPGTFYDFWDNEVDLQKGIGFFALNYITAYFPENHKPKRIDRFTTVGDIFIESAYTSYYGNLPWDGGRRSLAGCGYNVAVTGISPISGVIERASEFADMGGKNTFTVYKFYPLYDEDGGRNFPIIQKLYPGDPLFYEFESGGETIKVQCTWFYLCGGVEITRAYMGGQTYPDIRNVPVVSDILDDLDGKYFYATVDLQSLEFELAVNGGIIDDDSEQVGYAVVNNIDEVIIIN